MAVGYVRLGAAYISLEAEYMSLKIAYRSLKVEYMSLDAAYLSLKARYKKTSSTTTPPFGHPSLESRGNGFTGFISIWFLVDGFQFWLYVLTPPKSSPKGRTLGYWEDLF